jgi:hypothetical protein
LLSPWWQYMVDGLHIPIWNRTKRTSCNCFGWGGKGLRGKRWWGKCK